MGGGAVLHDADRALEHAALPSPVGVEERCGRLDVVVQHPPWLGPRPGRGHIHAHNPRLVPNALENLQGQRIALRPVEHRAGVRNAAAIIAFQLDVGCAVHEGRLTLVACGLELREGRAQDRPFVVTRRILFPPQHVFLGVVMHLPRFGNVKDARNDRPFPRS